MSDKLVTPEIAATLGVSKEELELIKKYLGRTPNFTELSIYSVMWSEHASYKNSIKWIKTLPRDGAAMLVKAGEENAGMVDIGDGQACVFKMESHNHPSAVEPYQGAATGVGGINRDIFTMGARPIAQLNSLRFGEAHLDKTKWLLKGVVKGIGNYGNAFGIPVVGGEVVFDKCYNANPLVNAMSVGIMQTSDLIKAVSKGVGNVVYIVGSSTGKDGIHGATFASADLHENSADDIPSIQVGDPFQEKLLLEATLEVGKTGAVIGMQDMGAAGIICSTSEMSEKGNHGMRVYLDKVPLRQKNMEAWEILLSESQERMLIVVEKGREKEVEAVFEKWDLNCAIIGEVIAEDKLYFYYHNELVAEVPAASLVLGGGAPVYDREFTRPAYMDELAKFNPDAIAVPENLVEVANSMLANANIASKKWVIEQYDSMVGTANISTNFPADAAIVNLKGTNKALALTSDCNSRFVYADPYKGAMMAVAEAARNIVCSGGKPLAITNCLNFGNPYNTEVYYQFVEAIKGMGEACRKLGTPVTGGNVSFYNQTAIGNKVEPIYPTPTIGMLGIIENKNKIKTMSFKNKGDMIYLLGTATNDFASSEYLNSIHGISQSPAPEFDIDTEVRMQQVLSALIAENLISSAHDISNGGLFVTLAECGFVHKLGFDITTDADIRPDAFLFSESGSRVVITVTPHKETKFIDFMLEQNFPVTTLGHVTKGEMRIDDVSYGQIDEAFEIFSTSLEKIISN